MDKDKQRAGQASQAGGGQTAQHSEGSAKLQGDKLGDTVKAVAGTGEGSGAAQGRAVAQQQGGGQQATTSERRTAGVLRPPVDVIEDAQGITLMADMPGVSKDSLNLRLDAQSLTIEGAMSLQLPPQLDSRYAEIRHQHYERTFALSRELDGDKATAELTHGVLKVRIPKTAQATPRKIPVNVASA